jgi:hypothetical protein
MNIYLDSLDSFYLTKQNVNKNDYKIGIISLIGIIMYIAFLISGWLK